MVTVILDKKFITGFSKINDHLQKERIKNQIKKIKNNPKIGEPMDMAGKEPENYT
jgi:hypothetical protein